MTLSHVAALSRLAWLHLTRHAGLRRQRSAVPLAFGFAGAAVIPLAGGSP